MDPAEPHAREGEEEGEGFVEDGEDGETKTDGGAGNAEGFEEGGALEGEVESGEEEGAFDEADDEMAGDVAAFGVADFMGEDGEEFVL